MILVIKKINSKLITPIIMMVITGALLIASTLAWFSHNTQSGVTGLKVSVTDERITLGDTLTVTRALSTRVTTQIYKCEGSDNYYYLFEDGAYATDGDGNKIPFYISGLLPGETVDVSFTYTCTDSLIGRGISARLTDISSDTFTEIDYPDIKHSVLGVYKYSAMEDGTFGEETWLVDYVSGTADDIPESVMLFENSVWSKVSETPEDNYVSASFRFDFDLEQYYTLRTATNQLSEKSFVIGELRIEVTD